MAPVLQRPLRNKLQATERYITVGIYSAVRVVERYTSHGTILPRILDILYKNIDIFGIFEFYDEFLQFEFFS